MFDVSTVNDVRLKVDGAAAGTPQRINLSSLAGGLTAEAMLDDLLKQEGPETPSLKLGEDPRAVDRGAYWWLVVDDGGRCCN